ncbi:MAG: hypothetical protein ACOCPW_04930 [Marinilabiliaceae bacterium]
MMHLHMKFFLFLIFFSGVAIAVEAQYRYIPGHSYPTFREDRAHQLFFHVDNNNFIKNNEYETDFASGHTLIGYGLQPELSYYAGDRFRLRAGVYLRQYSGLDHFSQVRPVLSAHLRLSPSVDVIMGALRGHVQHRLIEPLFDPERQYTRPVENGLQFLVERPWLWLDAWIDWEQFIRKGDSFPEWFTAGLSAEPSSSLGSDQWRMKFPVNVLAVHRGGEISDYPEPVQTSLNSAAGIHLEKEFSGKVTKAGLFGYGMTYRNLNDVGPGNINRGDAWYIGGMAESRRLDYMAGYFRGNDFIALRGQKLFQSASPVRENFYHPRRELITGKVGYHRTFLEKVRFSFLLETYYDLSHQLLDFSTSMQISFSPGFFLTETKFE